MSFKSKYGKKLLGESLEESTKYVLVFRDMFPPLVTEYDFIKHYSEMVTDDDKVVVILQNNQNVEVVRDVLNIYCQYMKNVVIHITSKEKEDLILSICKKIISPTTGGTLIFGCSTEDIQEFQNYRELCMKKYDTITVIDPISTAYDNNTIVSREESVNAIQDEDEMLKLIPNHLTNEETETVMQQLKIAAAVND